MFIKFLEYLLNECEISEFILNIWYDVDERTEISLNHEVFKSVKNMIGSENYLEFYIDTNNCHSDISKSQILMYKVKSNYTKKRKMRLECD